MTNAVNISISSSNENGDSVNANYQIDGDGQIYEEITGKIGELVRGIRARREGKKEETKPTE